MTAADARPIVLLTGAAGNLGRSVAKALADGYRIVGLDRQARDAGKGGQGSDDSFPILAVDLGSEESVLAGGAAVLIQIPYSLDELLATAQFLRRRVAAGQPGLRVLFLGDTDDLPMAGDRLNAREDGDEFDRPLGAVLKNIVGGGVSLPWNLALAGLIGLSLLFTRVTLGAEAGLADAHHIIGCAVLTVVAIAAADVARPARALNALLGIGLMFAPLALDADRLQFAVTLGLGIALVLLSVRRGPILERYGTWNRLLV